MAVALYNYFRFGSSLVGCNISGKKNNSKHFLMHYLRCYSVLHFRQSAKLKLVPILFYTLKSSTGIWKLWVKRFPHCLYRWGGLSCEDKTELAVSTDTVLLHRWGLLYEWRYIILADIIAYKANSSSFNAEADMNGYSVDILWKIKLVGRGGGSLSEGTAPCAAVPHHEPMDYLTSKSHKSPKKWCIIEPHLNKIEYLSIRRLARRIRFHHGRSQSRTPLALGWSYIQCV